MRLHASGNTYKYIGYKLGVSRQRVEQIVNGPKPTRPIKEGVELLFWQQGIRKQIKGREYTRMQVRIRDKFTCQACGAVRTYQEVQKHNKKLLGLKGRMKLFDVHHLDGECGKNSLGYDDVNSMEKLITLCHKDHYSQPEHRTHTTEFAANVSAGHLKKRSK